MIKSPGFSEELKKGRMSFHVACLIFHARTQEDIKDVLLPFLLQKQAA